MSQMHTFDPPLYSLEENQFIIDHLGEPTVVAMRAVQFPVNPRAVRPVIEAINEQCALIDADNTPDRAEAQKRELIDRLKNASKVFLNQMAKWDAQKARSNRLHPRFPSLSAYTAKGRPLMGGIGSDSGQVRTYFNDRGERVPFAVEISPDPTAPLIEAYPERGQDEISSKGLKLDQEANRIECLVCHHTESFRPESRQSYALARGRMSKHLRSSSIDVESHREVHGQEFGGR